MGLTQTAEALKEKMAEQTRALEELQDSIGRAQQMKLAELEANETRYESACMQRRVSVLPRDALDLEKGLVGDVERRYVRCGRAGFMWIISSICTRSTDSSCE